MIKKMNMHKIMIVDDDPDILIAVKNGLEFIDQGYEVITANSGEQCFEKLTNNQIPDIILLDIMMPGMSGWVTYEKLRNNPLWHNIPIVFVTARTDRIAKNASNYLGDDYIEKPFHARNLKKRIDNIIKR